MLGFRDSQRTDVPLTSAPTQTAFIGFGEAGQAFAKGLRQDQPALAISAYDIKTDGPEAGAKEAEYQALDVRGAADCTTLCDGSEVILSLVTAKKAEGAAESAAQNKLAGALYLDCNSCAPETKRRAAKRVETAGGRYVDVAIMTPVHPKLHKAPCLLAGPHADAAHTAMTALGMNTQIAGDQIGDASTRKMIRSVMIKGLEALTLECFLAARQAGIESDIIASLETSFPGFNWQTRAPYMMERIATHGIRRADEMDEVAQTLRDLGITPQMTERTAQRQRDVGTLGLDVSAAEAQDLATLTDMILAGLASQPKG